MPPPPTPAVSSRALNERDETTHEHETRYGKRRRRNELAPLVCLRARGHCSWRARALRALVDSARAAGQLAAAAESRAFRANRSTTKTRRSFGLNLDEAQKDPIGRPRQGRRRRSGRPSAQWQVVLVKSLIGRAARRIVLTCKESCRQLFEGAHSCRRRFLPRNRVQSRCREKSAHNKRTAPTCQPESRSRKTPPLPPDRQTIRSKFSL